MHKIIPVILSGGSGTRLWPLSREQMPKQFLKLMDDYTLLQRTAKRAMDVLKTDGSRVVTITLKSLKDETTRQLRELSPALTRHILLEPQARNTAAAIAFATQYVQHHFGEDSFIWILPADHFIGDEIALWQALTNACDLGLDNYLVTFGMRPTRAETGYGYIRKSENLNGSGLYKVEKFVEKPQLEDAQEFIKSGEYLWNSGMHLFRASSGRDNFLRFSPQTWNVVRNAIRESSDMKKPAPMTYGAVKEEPFEKAILEKADRVAVVPCDLRWSDIGCWESLWEIKEKDEFGNALDGNVLCHDTKNSMVLAKNRLVTCIGVENIIVIETGDSVLVANKDCSGSLKILVQTLKKMNRAETIGYVPTQTTGTSPPMAA